MRKKLFILFFLIGLNNMFVQKTIAQNTLPSFSLVERSGKVIIGWTNPNPELRQIIIQRSTDSSKGFRSIVSMPDPTAFTNGYVDKPIDTLSYYYRIFCTMPGGRYFFTEAKKPLKEIIKETPKPVLQEIKAVQKNEISVEILVPTEIQLRQMNGEKVYFTDPSSKIDDPGRLEKIIRKDSVLNQQFFEPSAFIYTNIEGNLIIVLPEPQKRHFSLYVYQVDGTPIFNMKNIMEPKLLIDRSNFIHSGWFKYELFEGQKSKEKNKFFIPAEGK
jgi:hypothetical protein